MASSSKGNSSWLGCRGSSILIDAGISCRRIAAGVAAAGGDIKSLSAVLITHEHTDHIAGLATLLKHGRPKVYAPAASLDYIIANGYAPAGADLNALEDGSFCIGEVEVSAFGTPHDSIDSVGYRIAMPDGETLAVATDLGHITGEVREWVTGCRTVLLESNYDKKLLEMGGYPWFLKRRISSEQGHLENADSARFAADLAESGTARIILGHLSRENNSPALAFQAAEQQLSRRGARRGIDYELEVADYDSPSRLVRF